MNFCKTEANRTALIKLSETCHGAKGLLVKVKFNNPLSVARIFKVPVCSFPQFVLLISGQPDYEIRRTENINLLFT